MICDFVVTLRGSGKLVSVHLGDRFSFARLTFRSPAGRWRLELRGDGRGDVTNTSALRGVADRVPSLVRDSANLSERRTEGHCLSAERSESANCQSCTSCT